MLPNVNAYSNETFVDINDIKLLQALTKDKQFRSTGKF